MTAEKKSSKLALKFTYTRANKCVLSVLLYVGFIGRRSLIMFFLDKCGYKLSKNPLDISI